LEYGATAFKTAMQAGILMVHGFYTVGNPFETVEDMTGTFDLASMLPIYTLGFNRLCVYRGTPLWQEYVKRGLVSETTDWYKYFKCSTIDPTCLSGEVINEVRRQGLKRLFVYKLLHYPLQTFRLLRRFLRFMPARDVAYIIIKPFLGKGKGATKAEVLSRTVEHGQLKDAAAELTQMTDEMLHSVMEESGWNGYVFNRKQKARANCRWSTVASAGCSKSLPASFSTHRNSQRALGGTPQFRCTCGLAGRTI
jgi:hypothetical protein